MAEHEGQAEEDPVGEDPFRAPEFILVTSWLRAALRLVGFRAFSPDCSLSNIDCAMHEAMKWLRRVSVNFCRNYGQASQDNRRETVDELN